MIVGFTGTRQGMSAAQRAQLEQVLDWLKVVAESYIRGTPDGRLQFHHGDADGADKEAAIIAFAAGFAEVPHPAGPDPLVRDREIAALVEVLIAAPRTDKEELRSGTWATVRYARAAVKPVIMLSRGEP